MALALLAHQWARDRHGCATALTVDHALRPDSAGEAAQVGGWMDARGIPHHVLTHVGPRPVADLQAQARKIRYDLLERWCAANHVRHLLLAHHQDDQAETLMLRLGRGSGVAGLAAMAPVARRSGVTLLRPLLDVPARSLRDYLSACGQAWVEDPSNRDPRHARVRMRSLMPVLDSEGLSAARLAGTARRMARANDALDHFVAERAARSVALHPAGFATVRRDAFRLPPDEIGLRLLLAVTGAVGGGDYSPRADRAESLWRRLAGGEIFKATLAGCVVAAGADRVVVAAEAARRAGPLALVPGTACSWDGRFDVTAPEDLPPGLVLHLLGGRGGRDIPAIGRIPGPARAALPVLKDGDAIFAVPHLGYKRDGGTISGTWIAWRLFRHDCLVPALTGII